ncbi:MAG: homoserine dehydrogenase [Terracidiphilus sp.]|jgi:homoserine dehydrogenase
MSRVESSVHVVLIGLGAIGKGVVRHLYACKEEAASPFPKGMKVTLSAVIDYVKKDEEQEDRRKFLAGHFAEAALSFDGVNAASLKKLEKDFAEAKAKGVTTVVIECTGSSELVGLFDCCLANKVPVITPNKAFLAKNQHYLDTFREAEVPLLFEAAVGGGMSTIKMLRDLFGSDRISLMAGILNGTTNYIISTMEKGAGFADARRKACARHLAEPSSGRWEPKKDLDLNGSDTYSKISLLAKLAWGCTATVNAGEIESRGLPACFIRRADLRYAKEKLKSAIRFVGVARQVVNSAGEQSTDIFYCPVMLPAGHELCQIDGENNALLVASDFTGTSLAVGPGAGPSPTANAIVSDLLYVLRERAAHPESTTLAAGAAQRASDSTLKLRNFEDVWFGGYYLRFVVKDQPGLVGGIAELFGKSEIDVREILQLEHSQGEIRELLECAAADSVTVPAGDEWKYLPFAITVERASIKNLLQTVNTVRAYLEGEGALGVEPVIIPMMEIPRVNGWHKRGGLEELEAWSKDAAEQFQGDKLSVELFPERYLDPKNSRAPEILNAEEKQIKAGKVSVKRIFLCDPNSISEMLRTVIGIHQGKGVEVRLLDIKSADKYLRRIEDGLYVDFSVYDTQEIGIVELAVKESDGRMRTGDRGYQVYGSAELEGYIRIFSALWAFAERPRLG